MKVIITAGGRGTRISALFPDIPKPLVPVCGKPVLEHQIEVFRRYGLTDITIITGYLGEKIRSYFGDGSHWGVHIDYFHEDTPLGSGGALLQLRDRLPDEFFFVSGDQMFDMDLLRMIEYHHAHHADATLAGHPNSHPYDSSLLVLDENERVIGWLNKEDERGFCRNMVNAGIQLFTRKMLDEACIPLQGPKVDLDREILKPMVSKSRIYVYHTPEYIHDMGTPERLAETEKQFRQGTIRNRNLANPQKAVFFDRDGTQNVLNGFISKPEQLELVPDAIEAVRWVNSHGYLAIVITNQPVVARGECTVTELNGINNKLETLLGRGGAYLDAIYCCIHHPDKGFPGEIPEQKIDCSCRKPKPGLFYQARNRYHIDLAESYMIGDSDRDVEAGTAAGCKRSIKIGGNLLTAVKNIVS